MTLNLTIPQQLHTDFTPRITVIGVGGGGTNAVDNMIALNLQGVEFVVANTDAQQLVHSKADRRIQLGPHITQGLGAGAKPEIGRAAAEEAADELYRHLDGAHMVFITAGMGGGTGTGAAPVIARMARERNILTVGVVTKPFTFEGARRTRAAEAGIEELQQYVDTLIVIPNQNLFRLANERTGWKEAFKMADNVLYMGVRGVTDLMVAPGLVNLDFADIRTVMAEMGKAMMGTGEAEGENRAVRAAEAAISNPLLEDTSMAGARGLLINITGGDDMTLFEVDQAANRIREEVDEEANIIFGSAIDEHLNGKVRVSVVATGIESPEQRAMERPRLIAVAGGMPMHAQPLQHQPAPAPLQQQMAAPQQVPLSQPAAAQGAAVQNAAMQSVPGPGVHPAPTSGRIPPGATVLEPRMAPRRILQAAQPHAPEQAAEPLDIQAYYQPNQEQPDGAYQQEAPARAARAAVPPQVATARGEQAARQQARTQEGRQAAARALFADPQQPVQAPPQVQRKSLFGIVTGAIRGGAAVPPPHAEPPPVAARGVAQDPRQDPRPDPVRASVRQAAGDEMGIDIPAFLRRQSS